jgi:hypothetical protein
MEDEYEDKSGFTGKGTFFQMSEEDTKRFLLDGERGRDRRFEL